MAKPKGFPTQIEQADAAADRAVAPLASSRPVRIAALLSEIGDQPQLRALCLAAIGIGIVGRKPRLARAGVQMLLAHDLATELKNLGKRNIDRTRPRSRRGTDGHRFTAGHHHAKEQTSFPSGHSAGTFSVARAFGRHFPEHRGWALAAAGLIALIQIPRRAHYPSDVIAGTAIGLIAEAIVMWLFESLEPAREQQ